jgi:hypothetical protein
LIDNRHVRELYQYGVGANAAVHIARPFVSTITGAAFLNVANEQATNSYRLPFVKAFYDASSELPGYRIAYISSMECVGDFSKFILWVILAVCALHLSTVPLLKAGFISVGIVSLLLYMQNFSALKK